MSTRITSTSGSSMNGMINGNKKDHQNSSSSSSSKETNNDNDNDNDNNEKELDQKEIPKEKNDPMMNHNHSDNTNTTKKKKKIPLLCQFWSYVRIHICSSYFHFCGIDFTISFVCAILLGIFRYIAEYIQIILFNWPSNSLITKVAASSIPAILHSMILVPSLYVCLTSHIYHPNVSITYGNAPLWWQLSVDALLQFCTGYMIYDGILNLLWLKWLAPQILGNHDYNVLLDAEETTTSSSSSHISLSNGDILILFHHIATTVYMTSTRYINCGHQSALMCMFLGEITNPLHNSYYIAIAAQQLDCCNGPLSQFYFHIIEFCFCTLYCIIRSIIGPPILIHMTYYLWFQRYPHHNNNNNNNNSNHHHPSPSPPPIWLTLLWTILIWGVTIGSYPWIIECYEKLYYKYYNNYFSLLLNDGGDNNNNSGGGGDGGEL